MAALTASGAFAKEVARTRRVNVESAFLCGLLHGIGKPVVLRTAATVAREQQIKAATPMFHIVIGGYHSRVGCLIAEKWSLPKQVVEAIQYYGDYDHATSNPQECMLTCVADRLATHILAPEAMPEEQLRDHPVFAELNLYPNDIDQLVAGKDKVLAHGERHELMSAPTAFDIIVIRAGPAGQKAAIQGATAGKRVALIERERGIGGNCVYRGTIPSKTLRESALQLDRLKSAGAAFDFSLKPDIQIATLLSRLEDVISAHDTFMSRQLRRNGISLLHGRAGFLDARTIDMQTVDGGRQSLTADAIILATGSRPRNPENIPVDHEHILDSDSLLSMIYLPRSLPIIGGGVIGCEYASFFLRCWGRRSP